MVDGAISLHTIRLQGVEVCQVAPSADRALLLGCGRSAYFVLPGSHSVRLTGKQKEFTVAPAQMMLVAGEEQMVVAIVGAAVDQQARSPLVLKVELCEPFLFGLRKSLPRQLLIDGQVGGDTQRIADIADLIRRAQPSTGFLTSAKIDRLTELLFLEAIDCYMRTDNIDRGLLTAMADKRLRPALDAIHDNPDEVWTVQGLARLAGMSRSLFAVKFKSMLNETPVNYVRLCRMYRAKSLLRSSSATVDQVAQQAGYSSISSFVKAFSQINGETPGQWREQWRARQR